MPLAALTTRPRSKLLVLIIAEQFRSDYLDLLGNFFGAGGFRRLMDEGSYFPDCQIASTTFTSGGLATAAAGAYPQVHGIVADSWYDRQAGKTVSASLHGLEATTLADQFAAADTHNRVYSVGLNLREASLLAGRSATGILHLDSEARITGRGQLGTAKWLEDLNRQNDPDKLKNSGWFALGAQPGAPPLRILTFDSAHPEEFFALYRSSPFAQAAQFAAAQELVLQERLGQSAGADFLAIAIGSPALLGYEVGSDSPLMREMVLHLDRQVESFLHTLDKSVGAQNYSVVFTAAHGAPREPDTGSARLAVPGETVAQSINQALSAQYDVAGRKDVYVERYVYPFLYLKLDRLRRSYVDLREARLLAGRAALSVPGVTGFYTADDKSSHTGDWLRRFRNSFHAVRSGDVMLAYGPGYVEEYGAGRGVSYGSLYSYDSRVPLLLYGVGFNTEVFENQVEAVDLAPTLARLAGTAFPSSTTGRVLAEALAPPG